MNGARKTKLFRFAFADARTLWARIGYIWELSMMHVFLYEF